MTPKFANIIEYEKAQLLLQPIYIRLIDNLRKQSELLTWSVEYQEIAQPFPGYIVCLKKDNYLKKYNLWDLCFQICFTSYQSGQIEAVQTDKMLIDDRGELNWEALENKTKNLVFTLLNMEEID